MKKIKLLVTAVLALGVCSALAAPMIGDVTVPLKKESGFAYIYPEAAGTAVKLLCSITPETSITAGEAKIIVQNALPKILKVGGVKTLTWSHVKLDADHSFAIQTATKNKFKMAGLDTYNLYCTYTDIA